MSARFRWALFLGFASGFLVLAFGPGALAGIGLGMAIVRIAEARQDADD